VTWEIVYTKQAQKDAKKLAASGLKDKALELLDIIREDPFHTP
jgi:Txe/YoeB family toxin of Txe-Axe toxin-antitoxin module